MKKILFSLVILAFAGNVSAQTGANVKKPSIALKISAFDFTTARAIQVNTLGAVLNNKSWEKLSNSTKSIGVQYFKGVTPKMDFMVNLDLASLSYPFYASSLIKNAIGTASGATTKGFYAAADAGLNFKMLSDDHKVVPYLSASIGVGKFRSNYMAYAPVGAGIQIKANHGSFINILSTFRAEMSALTKTHFNHGVSYSMPLKLKEKKPVVLPPPPPPVFVVPSHPAVCVVPERLPAEPPPPRPPMPHTAMQRGLAATGANPGPPPARLRPGTPSAPQAPATQPPKPRHPRPPPADHSTRPRAAPASSHQAALLHLHILAAQTDAPPRPKPKARHQATAQPRPIPLRLPENPAPQASTAPKPQSTPSTAARMRAPKPRPKAPKA